VRAGFARGSPAFPLLLLMLLAVAFIAFARTTTGMATGDAAGLAIEGAAAGPAAATASPYRGRAAGISAAAPLATGLAALLVLGLWIPAGLDAVIRHSMAVIS